MREEVREFLADHKDQVTRRFAGEGQPREEQEIHDYRTKSWGHDIAFNPIEEGLKASATGWGPRSGKRIREGDFLILSNPESRSGIAPYKVTSVEYYQDPPDRFKAKLEFAPGVRSTE
jgi:hypothetical protein